MTAQLAEYVEENAGKPKPGWLVTVGAPCFSRGSERFSVAERVALRSIGPVDGTLIQAWAAARSFKEKSDPPKPGAGSGHGGEVLLRDKVESTTDPEARLFKKATADKSVPSYQGHVVMENRNGLVVGRRPASRLPMPSVR